MPLPSIRQIRSRIEDCERRKRRAISAVDVRPSIWWRFRIFRFIASATSEIGAMLGEGTLFILNTMIPRAVP